jgi:hypothetical protein
MSKKECDNLKAEYLSVLATAKAVYGPSLFRLRKKDKLLGRRSVPLSDAVLLGIRAVGDNADKLKNKKIEVLRATERLLADDRTYEVLVGRPNTKTAIEKRLKLLERRFKQIVKA